MVLVIQDKSLEFKIYHFNLKVNNKVMDYLYLKIKIKIQQNNKKVFKRKELWHKHFLLFHLLFSDHLKMKKLWPLVFLQANQIYVLIKLNKKKIHLFKRDQKWKRSLCKKKNQNIQMLIWKCVKKIVMNFKKISRKYLIVWFSLNQKHKIKKCHLIKIHMKNF